MTTDLIKRLEAGETGREIDAEIAAHFKQAFGRTGFVLGDKLLTLLVSEPKLSTSLDAAVALVERVRPDITAWEIRSRRAKRLFFAELSKLEGNDDQVMWDAYAPTPAAALIAALLKADG